MSAWRAGHDLIARAGAYEPPLRSTCPWHTGRDEGMQSLHCKCLHKVAPYVSLDTSVNLAHRTCKSYVNQVHTTLEACAAQKACTIATNAVGAA